MIYTFPESELIQHPYLKHHRHEFYKYLFESITNLDYVINCKYINGFQIHIAQNIQDIWYKDAEKNNIPATDFTILLLTEGPKVDPELKDNQISISARTFILKNTTSTIWTPDFDHLKDLHIQAEYDTEIHTVPLLLYSPDNNIRMKFPATVFHETRTIRIEIPCPMFLNRKAILLPTGEETIYDIEDLQTALRKPKQPYLFENAFPKYVPHSAYTSATRYYNIIGIVNNNQIPDVIYTTDDKQKADELLLLCQKNFCTGYTDRFIQNENEEPYTQFTIQTQYH